mgnify:CR=1 FL=1|jgi:excisionase family DNA binding protein|tara:strand:- start:259 stop:462 length:204 start_codon:yes stop_codon:yes gene_type:complete
MKIMMNVMDKPCVTISEACWILSLSASTIKRKINSGVIKCVERDNLREKILIYTDSLAKFLEKSGEV